MATTNTTRVLPRDIVPGMVIEINVPPRHDWRIPNLQNWEVIGVEKSRAGGATKYGIRIRVPDDSTSIRWFGPRDSVKVVTS